MAERRLPAVLVSIVALGAFAFVAIGLLFANSLPGRLLTGGGFRPGPRQPPGGPAVVDGHQTEWTLVDELFTDVHRGGEESEKVEAQLYLRYDCRTNLMYALFLSAGEWPIMLRRSQVRVALDSASEELPIVEFAWMEPGYDGNSQHARGWEASFAVNPGEHLLWVAALAMDEGEVEEANTPNAGLPILLTCNHPTTLFLKRLQALPSSGRIRLEWETAWEVNNLGFNVYHSSAREGPWTQLNQDLIDSQAAQNGTAGAQYEYVHPGVDLEADNYYLLEGMAIDGIPTRYGPVQP